MKPEEQMLISAVRYALGRQTYIVGDTCAFVKQISDKLSKKCIAILITDIEREIDWCHALGKTCGMECDEADWRKLLETLKQPSLL